MLRQLLIGGLISLANIAIHAVVMATVVNVARVASKWESQHAKLWLTATMVATVGTLLIAHVIEVMTWTLAYTVLGVAPGEASMLYFAFVNYTTLGYGDVVPVERWLLLGPMTAMNGILLFGWSTAVIFEVLRGAMRFRDFSNAPVPDSNQGGTCGRIE